MILNDCIALYIVLYKLLHSLCIIDFKYEMMYTMLNK